MTNILLETKNLSKKIQHQFLIEQVNLKIERGTIYGLIGSSRAGKSTLLKLISGLTQPTSGEVLLFNQDIDQPSMRSRIGLMIEEPSLYSELNALDHLRMKQFCIGIGTKKALLDLLESVELKEVALKKVKSYTQSMKMRLGLALALLGSPDLLVLDEPFRGLDPIEVRAVRQVLKKLVQERQMTIVFSSHNLAELSKLANQYGFLSNGKLVKQIMADDLEQACGEFIEIEMTELHVALPIIEKLGITDYSVIDKRTIRIENAKISSGQLNSQLVKSGLVVEKILTSQLSLEEYYLKTIGETKDDKTNQNG